MDRRDTKQKEEYRKLRKSAEKTEADEKAWLLDNLYKSGNTNGTNIIIKDTWTLGSRCLVPIKAVMLKEDKFGPNTSLSWQAESYSVNVHDKGLIITTKIS
jgi:hypothetical protein